MNETQKIVDQLKQDWGISFPPVRKVIEAVVDGHTSKDVLVAQTGLSRRGVERVLDRLSPLLTGEHGGFSGETISHIRAAIARPPIDEAAALARIRSILEKRPKPNRSLDHVAATPESVLRRALYLVNTFDLSGAAILLLGDHDLTATGLASVVPSLDLWVCDVDERLLAFIDQANLEHDFQIRTVFADFRVELPRSLTSRFNIVFTDPPYTEPGIRLFLQRSVHALNNVQNDRILLAYGYGEDQVTLGYKIQSVIHEQRLLQEAILPDFSEYEGAQAIGSRSSLHVMRPTRRSLAAARNPEKTQNLYSHGKSSEEVDNAELPGAITAGLCSPEPDLVVGLGIDGLPAPMTLADYLHSGNLPGEKSRVLINLFPHFDSYLVRAICHSQADTLVVCGSQRPLADLFAHDSDLKRLVTSKYALIERVQEGPVGRVVLSKRKPESPQAKLLADLTGRPGAKLANAWREALITASPVPIAKNQARAIVTQSNLGAQVGDLYLSELPLHVLSRLPDSAEQMLTLATQTA